MPRTERSQFQKDAKSYGGGGGMNKFSKFKKEGVAIGYIHPKVGVWDRYIHGAVPSKEVNDKGEMVNRRRRPICIGAKKSEVPNETCPMCLLQEFAIERIQSGIQKDEVVLSAVLENEKLALDWADLSGDNGYFGDPKAKKDVLMLLIPQKGDKSDVKKAFEILNGPQTLGEKLFDVIDSEIENRGELKGDIVVPEGYLLVLQKGKLMLIPEGKGEAIEFNPYPVKFRYAKDEKPASKYSVMKMDRDLCPITPEIQQVMLASGEELGVDLEKMAKPTPRTKQLEILKSSWDSDCSVSFEEFEHYVQRRAGKAIDAEKEEETEFEPKKMKAEEPKETPKLAQEDGTKFCPECGKKNPLTGKFCQFCGAKLIAKEEPKVEAKRLSEVKCAECGEIVEPMKPSNRCPECGEKIKNENEDVPL